MQKLMGDWLTHADLKSIHYVTLLICICMWLWC